MFIINDILKATQGKLINGNASSTVKGFSIDSRTLKKGDAFIAIKGKSYDGHAFANKAIRKGASAIIISKKRMSLKTNVPIIKVADTLEALGKIAKFCRECFDIPIIAITGSTGKTTTKEMLASILSAKYKVLKNIATQNNAVGVPLTLLRLKKHHDAAVLELGTNQFGEIKYLTQIAHPTISVVTNIGESHLQSLKTPTGVFREKSNLIKYMDAKGVIFLNNDDPYAKRMRAQKKGQRVFGFGIKNSSNYHAKCIENSASGSQKFFLNNKRFQLRTLARHNIYNALAAISCSHFLKVPYDDIQKRLKTFNFPEGRQKIYKTKKCTIIDDSYNSNPVSLRSAITTLADFKTKGRKILVCADMLELGRQSKKLHKQLGSFIASFPIDYVFTYGKNARFVGIEIKKCNKRMCVIHSEQRKSLRALILRNLHFSDVILVKGSRSMEMERIVDFIKSLKTKG